MKTQRWLALVGLALIGLVHSSVRADVITFDDLTFDGRYSLIPDGYHGLHWSNFYVLNSALEQDVYGPSGYTFGMVSQPQVAFNGFGDQAVFSDSSFTLKSAFLTAAWNDGLTVSIQGYRGSQLAYSKIVTLSTVAPTYVNFSWIGITSVIFTSYGGTNPGYSGSGTQFVLDNMEVSSGTSLNVQRFSQGDPQWADDTYDHSDYTIQEKGCALSCLAMALNYVGVDVNPGSLDTLMNDPENEGDWDGTAVNWDPATRDASDETVEFHAFRSQNPSDILDVLQQGYPVIVGVNLSNGTPSHFVLVTGEQNGQFTIADPGHADRTTLDAYSSFETRGYVADPPGDVSSLNLGVGDGVTILVTDVFGHRTGTDSTGAVVEEIPQSVHFSDSLDNDVTEEPATETDRQVHIYQPAQGDYQIQVTGVKLETYEIVVRAFAQNGAPAPVLKLPGVTGPGATDLLQLHYTSDGSALPALTRVASYNSTLGDIRNSRSLGLIDSDGIATALSSMISAAAKAKSDAKPGILGGFKNYVNAQQGIHINNLAARVLLEDADSLLGH